VNGFPVLGYDLAVYILPSIVGLLLLVGGLALWAYVRVPKRGGYYDDGFGWALTASIGLGASVLMAIIVALCAIPWDARYWTWYVVDGHVDAVSNTLRDASGDLTTTPVVTVDGLDRPVVVSDPRIVTMAGHDVTLSCKPTWHFRAADSYTCRIYEYVGSN
jgi:hypothetical protein